MKRLIWLFLFLLSTSWAQYIATVPATGISGGGGVAATYVTSGNASTGSHDCTVTLSVTAGQFAVATVENNSNPGTNVLTISDTNSDSFTQAPSSPYVDGTVSGTAAWVAKLSTTNASEAFDMHLTDNTNFASCGVAIYSGPTTLAWDQGFAGANNTAVTSLVSGTTGTTTQAKELVVGIFGGTCAGGNTGNFTAGSGYTLRINGAASSTNACLDYEDQNVTSPGTYSATMTAAASQSGALITATLKGN